MKEYQILLVTWFHWFWVGQSIENQLLKHRCQVSKLLTWCVRPAAWKFLPVIKLLRFAYGMRLKQAARLQGEIASLYVMELFPLGKRKGKNSYPVSLWACHTTVIYIIFIYITVIQSNVGMTSVHRERELWGEAGMKSGRADSKYKNEESFLISFISGTFLTSSSLEALWSWSVKLDDFLLAHCR